MKHLKSIIILVFSAFFGANYTVAQKVPAYPNLTKNDSLTAEGKRIYKTQRLVGEAPKVDGKLTDNCWDEGYWSGSYLQHLPEEGALPSQQTQLKILYDDKNIYVAIRCFDNEPDKIDRQLGRRDEFGGDMIGINFDSYFDKRTGFEFNLRAGGTQIDLLLENDGWDPSWNAVWEGETAMEDSAWTAEYRIPLSQLRYSSAKEQVWGLHSWRWINRNQEESNWNLIPRDNPGFMRSIGELHGISNLPKSRRIEVLPYVLGKTKFYEKEEGNPFADGFDPYATVGVDAKIGITSDFTMNLTVNPDFGQVEADPAVLNLSAFETFFDEKRPFFLEGKNITNFGFEGGRLFYSRRIGSSPKYSASDGLNDGEYAQSIQNTSILGAVKLTGKTQNGLAVGIIEGLTAKELAKVKTDDGEDKVVVEPLSNYFVARIQQDINKGNTIVGGILTNTSRKIDDAHLDFLTDAAYTGGIDFITHWKDKTYYFETKGVFSSVQGSEQSITDLQYSSARYFQRPDADHLEIDSTLNQLSGYGAEFEIGKRGGGRWRYGLELSYKNPGLEVNDIGFLPTVDHLNQKVEVAYVVNEPIGNIREYAIHSSQNNNLNSAGEYLGSSVHFSGNMKFENMWNYFVNYNRMFDEKNTRILRGGPSIYTQGFHCISAGFSTNESKKVSFGFNYHTHIFDSKLSDENSISPNVTWRVTNALKFSANTHFSLSTSGFQYLNDDYDDEYFLSSLYQKTLGLTFRADYAINPKLTLQYYANPFISVGEYSKFKIITDPTAKEYDNLYHEFSDNEVIYDPNENTYDLNFNGQVFTIDNPDFNFMQFRSNFVARWEYKMGSTLYFVWSNNRSLYNEVTNMHMNNSINHLVGLSAENVFLVKFNYWFSL